MVKARIYLVNTKHLFVLFKFSETAVRYRSVSSVPQAGIEQGVLLGLTLFFVYTDPIME